MLLISISLRYVVGLLTLAIGTLSSQYSGRNILSSCFLCLVQDAPALPICHGFVATAIVLPEVNPLEHDVPLKPRCRISTDILM